MSRLLDVADCLGCFLDMGGEINASSVEPGVGEPRVGGCIGGMHWGDVSVLTSTKVIEFCQLFSFFLRHWR